MNNQLLNEVLETLDKAQQKTLKKEQWCPHYSLDSVDIFYIHQKLLKIKEGD